MRVLHIINSLKKGGAEGNLYRLCSAQKKKYKNKIDITIITLIDNGYYEHELKKKGIKIFSLQIKNENKIPSFLKKIAIFRKFIKKLKPDIIQSWMYHSNFLSIFIPKIYFNKIFWNIRHSELNSKISKKTTIVLSLICGFFSRIVPKKIIYCSEKSIKFHENMHLYSKKKSSLIDNGFSKRTYYSSKSLRINFRTKNKIKQSDIILGFAGRYAKQKNIDALLHAFHIVSKKYNNIFLYMAGRDININNRELINIIDNFKLTNKVFFLSQQKNLLKFYNGIDLLLLPSHSESFPNVVAEAMLCSTLVLASDAGSSKKIIDKYGFVLNKNNHEAISEGLKKSINEFIYKKKKWRYLKKNARSHIKKNFSIEKMADKYLNNWIN